MENIKKQAEDWWDDMEYDEQIEMEKKHGYYGHDIGTNIDDIVQMFKEEFKINVITNIKKYEYTKEDIKNFGLFLGSNLKKHKNKSIDELFDEWIKKS